MLAKRKDCKTFLILITTRRRCPLIANQAGSSAEASFSGFIASAVENGEKAVELSGVTTGVRSASVGGAASDVAID